ncbi:NAD-dependent DNA ligase LigA [Planctomicrobium sp. SH668]|uniref:NAD-dependent DNA ligase LigA n=1 Tax=Planctomicrobium sp. SH668 TaxID=3448126 RepID=UPI003F5B9D46
MSSFPDAQIRDLVVELRQKILHHNRLYYVEDRTEIADFEFDNLVKELERLEKEYPELDSPDSPTHKVGGAPIDSFKSIDHRIPMLSIDNVYSEEELHEFDGRIQKLLGQKSVEYSVEFKIDGVALALIYEHGKLTQAVTRGDGRRGDDVTSNARTLRGVPLLLDMEHPPARIEVRGEAYIANSDFARLRAEQVERGEEPYANPRNTTAGAMKLLDPKLCAARKVRFLAHGVGDQEGLQAANHSELLHWLREAGLPTTRGAKTSRGIGETVTLCQQMMDSLHELDFEVDGLVIKVNSFSERAELGYTTKSPRWAIAYKWEKYEAVTRVNHIEVCVGKTGVLTPLAHLDPVLIAGSTISRASLHNRDEIERLGIKVGDWIVVEKAGKVIPHVVRVEEHRRDGTEQEFPFPTRCPDCQSEVRQDEGGVYIRCLNPACPAQLRESLRYFASRQAMEIDGMGIKIIEQLLENQLLTSFADIYRLKDKRSQLLALDRMGVKSVDHLLDGIEASKSQPLWRLLTALNIRHVGTTVSRSLAETFGTLDNIRQQSAEQLSEVQDIGAVIAHSIANFFHSEAGNKIIEELRECGLNFGTPLSERPPAVPAADQPYAGKTLVVTGTMVRFTRDEIHELIYAAGGKPGSSVSSKTDFLIAGDKAGTKEEKAKKLNIKIITEDEFLAEIGKL